MISMEEMWTQRYQNGRTGWDLGEVSPPIKTYVDQLTDKSLRILIPGAGNGYEAEYIYNQGFRNVHICDISKIPLDNFKRRNPDFSADQVIHKDFFKLSGSFDLILEHTFFCALPVSYREDYVNKVDALLKSGGKLVGVLFDRYFTHDGPPFGGNQEEYKRLFGEKLQLTVLERCYNSIPPRAGSEVFIIAEKQ